MAGVLATSSSSLEVVGWLKAGCSGCVGSTVAGSFGQRGLVLDPVIPHESRCLEGGRRCILLSCAGDEWRRRGAAVVAGLCRRDWLCECGVLCASAFSDLQAAEEEWHSSKGVASFRAAGDEWHQVGVASFRAAEDEWHRCEGVASFRAMWGGEIGLAVLRAGRGGGSGWPWRRAWWAG
jgi:hypothetical protein